MMSKRSSDTTGPDPGPWHSEINRLRTERDEWERSAQHEHERAEREYETVDEIAKILIDEGRPANESIPDGVRRIVEDRDRLRERVQWFEAAGGVAMATRIYAIMHDRDRFRDAIVFVLANDEAMGEDTINTLIAVCNDSMNDRIAQLREERERREEQ